MLSYTCRSSDFYKIVPYVPSVVKSIRKEQASEGACVGNSKGLECGYEIRALRSRAPYQYIGANQTRENCLLSLSAHKLV